MLLQTLKSVCWDAVPQVIQLELVRFNRANAQKNLIFTGELLRLLDSFQTKWNSDRSLQGTRPGGVGVRGFISQGIQRFGCYRP